MKQSKARQVRLLDLTLTEINALGEGVATYEGIGKMFLQTPRSDVVARLDGEKAVVTADMTALDKKAEYLQKTHDNARLHMRAALGQTS